MSLDWFFEKFELIADLPNAVGRIRQLALTLAFQGGLVPQQPDDEPADVLLKRIQSRQDGNLTRRNARRTVPVVNVAPIYNLPPSWAWTSLGSIADWGSGSTPPRGNPELYGGQITWLKSGELNDNQLLTGSEERITELALKQGSFRHNQPGDILFAMYGATVGKLAILAEYAVTNQAVCGCTPHTGILNKYLFHYLLSQRQHFRNASEGGAQPNFSKDKIVTYPFPLPPLAEQHRIVAKVDELMALCDQLEAQQQEREARKSVLARAALSRFAAAPTPANLNLLFHPSYTIPPSELRKTILTLAVRGKLVPQDPNDEPAAQAIERIDALQKFPMRIRATEDGGDAEPSDPVRLFELPPGWTWAPFRRLPLQVSVGIDRGRSTQGPNKAVGYFKMSNIRNAGGVDLSDLTRIDATPNEITEFALADGDFLFNTRNSRELVGKTCVFRSGSDEPILYNNNILRVKLATGFEPDFLDYWFRSPEGSTELEKLKSSTTNVCAIYQRKLYGFLCVVPPLAEQRRIVAKVEQLMSLVDAFERQLESSRVAATKLLTALVAELTEAQTR